MDQSALWLTALVAQAAQGASTLSAGQVETALPAAMQDSVLCPAKVRRRLASSLFLRLAGAGQVEPEVQARRLLARVVAQAVGELAAMAAQARLRRSPARSQAISTSARSPPISRESAEAAVTAAQAFRVKVSVGAVVMRLAGRRLMERLAGLLLLPRSCPARSALAAMVVPGRHVAMVGMVQAEPSSLVLVSIPMVARRVQRILARLLAIPPDVAAMAVLVAMGLVALLVPGMTVLQRPIRA